MRIVNFSLVAIALAIAASSALFSWHYAMAVPRSDAWDFVEIFIKPVTEHGLTWSDLFVQRMGVDHSQPLGKLVLWLHLTMGELDFWVEALVGQGFALVSLWLAWSHALSASRPVEEKTARNRLLGLVLIAFAVFSLNSSESAIWSLVGLGWIYISMSMAAWAVWLRFWGAPGVVGGLVGAALIALCFDEAGLISIASGILAVLSVRWKSDPKSAIKKALAISAGAALGRWALAAVTQSSVDPSTSDLASTLGPFLDGGWKILLTAPTLGSLLHKMHWSSLAVSIPDVLVGAAVVGIIGLHLAFWVYVICVNLDERHSQIRVGFAAATMLFCYGCVAGIVFGRVPDFGWDYLWQPRYLMFYQLQWIAIAGALYDSSGRCLTGPRGSSHSSAPKIIMMLLAISVCLASLAGSVAAWRSGPYLQRYEQQMAAHMRQLVRSPEKVSPDCPELLTVCNDPPLLRSTKMQVLSSQELSIFSNRFLARHPHLMNNQLCGVVVEAWGPRTIQLGRPFNRQPNGQDAFWVQMKQYRGSPLLSLDDRRIGISRVDRLLTFAYEDWMAAAARPGTKLTFTFKCEGVYADSFEVSIAAGAEGNRAN